RENGITEVPVYRGMGFEKLPSGMGIKASMLDGQVHEVQIGMRAASSFSADAEMALSFANTPVADIDHAEYALVMAARVPAEAILGIPQTGFGALKEFEVVTLGGVHDAVFVGTTAARGELSAEQVASLLVAPERAATEDVAFATARAQSGFITETASYDLTPEDKAFAAQIKSQVDALDQSALTHDHALNIGAQIHDRIMSDPVVADLHDYAAEARAIATTP